MDALWLLIALSLMYWLILKKISIYLLKRSLVKIIAILRTKEAVSPENAKTIQELGFHGPESRRRIFQPSGYRKTAFNLLLHSRVIVQTYDSRVFLSERALKTLCEHDPENLLGFRDLVHE